MFRLTTATVTYLIKHSQILFKVENEEVYSKEQRVDKGVYLLLYGRCKLKVDDRMMGIQMGIGYVFNEESLFAKDRYERANMAHVESLVTTEESAYLRIDTNLFNSMIDVDSPNRTTS